MLRLRRGETMSRYLMAAFLLSIFWGYSPFWALSLPMDSLSLRSSPSSPSATAELSSLLLPGEPMRPLCNAPSTISTPIWRRPSLASPSRP